ncbi:DNA topoisomerase [Microbulbifer taiwanensis]|uniref:DNA topoisomerase n=1 Tax=Microbulbifer taiwanensis TaxID=986746 RepID=A0ABW1YWW5_9GAMM
MKRRGIGRPSSYASIVKNIIDKGQVQMKGRSLIPGELGEATIALLEHNFSFLSLDFTRNLEVALDRIANSEDTYMNVVQQFYQLLQTELQTLRALPSAQDEPRASSTASISSAPTSDFLAQVRSAPGPPQESRQGRLRLLGLQRLSHHRVQGQLPHQETANLTSTTRAL